jgi:hypothetical protein
VKAALLAVSLLALPAAASARELQVGLEDFYYRTAETVLNRGNVLRLDPGEDLLRATLHWREDVRDDLRLVVRGFVQRRIGAEDTTDWKLRQAYAQWSPLDIATVRVGRQRIAWGSGLAWNPTNRIEAPKNPLNVSLEQQGSLAVRVDVVPFTWAGLILVAARSEVESADLPFAVRAPRRRTAAVRGRFLVRDTDLAVVLSGGSAQPSLVGLDVGRTVGEVAVHAEAATYRGAEMAPPRTGERFVRLTAGLLWTRGEHLTLAAEYFFNGEGYGDPEREDWLQGLRGSSAAALDPRLPPPQRDAAAAQYAALAGIPFAGGLGLGRHYLHASWSSRMSAGRWTTSARAVLGLSDGSVALTPGVQWSPRGDLGLELDAIALLGPESSEFRLAPLRTAVQARVKVQF